MRYLAIQACYRPEAGRDIFLAGRWEMVTTVEVLIATQWGRQRKLFFHSGMVSAEIAITTIQK